MPRSFLLAAAMLGVWIGAGIHPAAALILIPEATPVGTAVDTITLNGSYTAPLPTPLAQPFAAQNFVLTFSLPAELTTSFVSPYPGFAVSGIAGSYSNNGQTETFSNQLAIFSSNTNGGGLSVDITGLLVPTDFFDLSTQTGAPLYTVQTGGPVSPLYTLTVGSFTFTGSATYGVDPGFTGSGSVQTAAPEPAGLALLLPALAGLGLLRRSRRSPATAPA